ncbi:MULTISPECIES: amidohydrolase family protein [Cellulomonas]|uniref:amidohydrolase family protein n=1 Tax=Cellulomonas TaxID=1707 RepID=UPI0010A913BC|nr:MULTISPECIES: amidohydrolase family protein [Cellulomonas]
MTTCVVRAARVRDAGGWATRDLVVRDGVLADVTPAGQAADADDGHEVDAAGWWAAPVLTDAHCHLLPGHLLRLPLYGVGFAMDLFSAPGARAGLDREAASGGARYATAGVGAAVRGGHPYQLVAAGLYPDFPSVAESGGPEAFVRALVASGGTVLKVFLDDGRLAGTSLPTFTPREVAELVAAAHAHDCRVVVHAPSADLACVALGAGADGLAHAPVPESDDQAEELVEVALRHGAFLVSTLVATASALGLPQSGSLAGSPVWERVPAGWRAHLRRSGRAAPDRAAFDRLLGLVARAHERGVPVLPGTDAAFPGVVPGASLHVELELLHRCGVEAHALLDLATAGLRERLGLGGGRLVRGARAEVALLDEDPAETVHAWGRLRALVLGTATLRF